MVDLVERIEIMLWQESSVYRTKDYLSPNFQQQLASGFGGKAIPPLGGSGPSSVSSVSSSSSTINELWREKICEWSYQVIDHFDFSREVVSVSIHYLDRYLATCQVNKKMFQLVAMTSLFLAVKLYEPGKIGMSSMIELSRGYFTVEQMEAMELMILKALSWQVHPPTAYCFAKHFLFLLPYTSVGMDVRHEVLEVARFLTELSVIDYFFVSHRPSVVALAALLNAIEDIHSVSDGSDEVSVSFLREVQKVCSVESKSSDVISCRSRLRLLYAQGGYTRPTIVSPESGIASPVCVSHGCDPYTQQSQYGSDYRVNECQKSIVQISSDVLSKTNNSNQLLSGNQTSNLTS